MNCLQLSTPHHSDKNVHLDQSDLLLQFFLAKYGNNKTCLFVTEIAIKNIQCRAGVRPALEVICMSSDADSAAKENLSFA